MYDWSPEKGFTEDETGDDDYIPRRPLGAGAHLGLTVILDAQINEYFCSSTSSIGFKVKQLLLVLLLRLQLMHVIGYIVEPARDAQDGGFWVLGEPRNRDEICCGSFNKGSNRYFKIHRD